MDHLNSSSHTFATSASEDVLPKRIYHEKQERMLCGMHALNNLLQNKTFTSEDLDKISTQLSPNNYNWLNPHKTPFLGNYDVNVIMKALQNHSYIVDWFDKRLDATTQNFDEIYGFILNIPTTSVNFGLMKVPWNGKHWLAIRKIDGIWYNLDSKLPQPRQLGSAEEVGLFLREALQNDDVNLFVIKLVFKSAPDLFEHICVHLEDKSGTALVIENIQNDKEVGLISSEITNNPPLEPIDDTEDILGVGYDNLVPLLDIILDRFNQEENDILSPPVKVTDILPPIDSFSCSQLNTQVVDSCPIDWNALLENFPSAADAINFNDSFSGSITVDDIFPKSGIDVSAHVLSRTTSFHSSEDHSRYYRHHQYKDGSRIYHHQYSGKVKGRCKENGSSVENTCCDVLKRKSSFSDKDFDDDAEKISMESSSDIQTISTLASSPTRKSVHFNSSNGKSHYLQGNSRTFVSSSKRTVYKNGSTPKSRAANRKANMFNTETGEYYTPEFILKEGLKKKRGHLNSIQKPYVCPVPGCAKSYKNPNGIKYHAKYGHSAPQEFPCHCGKMYSTRHGLMAHKKVHGPNITNGKSTTTLNKMKISKVKFLSTRSISGSESDESCGSSSKNGKSSISQSDDEEDESSDCEELEECRSCIGCGLK